MVNFSMISLYAALVTILAFTDVLAALQSPLSNRNQQRIPSGIESSAESGYTKTSVSEQGILLQSGEGNHSQIYDSHSGGMPHYQGDLLHFTEVTAERVDSTTATVKASNDHAKTTESEVLVVVTQPLSTVSSSDVRNVSDIPVSSPKNKSKQRNKQRNKQKNKSSKQKENIPAKEDENQTSKVDIELTTLLPNESTDDPLSGVPPTYHSEPSDEPQSTTELPFSSSTVTPTPSEGMSASHYIVIALVTVVIIGTLGYGAYFLYQQHQTRQLRMQLMPVYNFDPTESDDWENQLLEEEQSLRPREKIQMYSVLRES